MLSGEESVFREQACSNAASIYQAGQHRIWQGLEQRNIVETPKLCTLMISFQLGCGEVGRKNQEYMMQCRLLICCV